ncbi:OLC1v1010809C1 [Oldenlandia corymbosa var. corymbosa]|uniref:OLC1v1010809C1 n=1 Tax=Oldenlandia corymbosa var. corymbosa TaxID=529605 RepID=A0AAV1DS85_OLDCO|nr:OLC1v1010809C1 [Oldenlandia corymbosa var. corymbosa]
MSEKRDQDFGGSDSDDQVRTYLDHYWYMYFYFVSTTLRSRKENLSPSLEHESNGNMTAAYKYYEKIVVVLPSVAYDLIQVLKLENVSYIVAPYEANAKITYLAVSKEVDVVIIEDSDFNVYGCPRMILEMCILSGCDYPQSLPGMGLQKANALIKKFKSYDRVNGHQ